MKAFAEGLVLIGGFLAFAAFGYYAISKLGDFLDHNDAYMDGECGRQGERDSLNVAAADLWAMQAGSKVLKDMKNQHPELRCTFSMGEGPELLHALHAGDVDVVIVHAKAESGRKVRQKEVILPAQPFVNEDGVTIAPVDPGRKDQFVVWKDQDCRPCIAEFVQKLCGQKV